MTSIIIEGEELSIWDYQSLKGKKLSERYQINAIVDFLDSWLDQSDTITVNTSGSTGKPKEIKLSKKAMIISALKTERYFGYSSGQSILLALPVEFIAGKMVLVRAIVSNLDVILVPLTTHLKLPNTIVDFAPMTPMQYENMGKASINVGTYLLGGGPVSSGLMQNIRKSIDNVFLGFGMTETITHIAVKKLSSVQDHFEAIEGVEFDISELGTLIIHADHLEDSIQSNDSIELLDKTRFRWLGRIDNVINSAGVKLHPEQMESILTQVLSNNKYFIYGEAHPKLNQIPILYIEGDENPKLINSIESVISDIKPTYKRPQKIYFVEKFELTDTGKIKRKSY